MVNETSTKIDATPPRFAGAPVPATPTERSDELHFNAALSLAQGNRCDTLGRMTENIEICPTKEFIAAWLAGSRRIMPSGSQQHGLPGIIPACMARSRDDIGGLLQRALP
jgi:hypothetical protein